MALTFENLPAAIEELIYKVDRLEGRLSNQEGISASIERPMTSEEVCQFLSISEPTLIRWRKKGKIPFLKIGTNIRYNKAAVIKAMEAKK